MTASDESIEEHQDEPLEGDDVADPVEDATAELGTTEPAPVQDVRTTQACCHVCGRAVYYRGLCGAHYQTHRGVTVKGAKHGG